MRKRLELTVGARGEIYTTEDVRRIVGIERGSVVLAEAAEKQLILRPKETPERLLEKPRFDTAPVGPKQLSRLRSKLARELEER